MAHRLAVRLVSHPKREGSACVTIDGAQVRVHGREVFPIEAFLAEQGRRPVEQAGKNGCQCAYRLDGRTLVVHAPSGVGDVVATLDGRRYRVGRKQGPLVHKPRSCHFPMLREALRQPLTIESVEPTDVQAAAAPRTNRLATLAERWRRRPLPEASGIQIVVVDRNGEMGGLRLDRGASRDGSEDAVRRRCIGTATKIERPHRRSGPSRLTDEVPRPAYVDARALAPRHERALEPRVGERSSEVVGAVRVRAELQRDGVALDASGRLPGGFLGAVAVVAPEDGVAVERVHEPHGRGSIGRLA